MRFPGTLSYEVPDTACGPRAPTIPPSPRAEGETEAGRAGPLASLSCHREQRGRWGNAVYGTVFPMTCQ